MELTPVKIVAGAAATITAIVSIFGSIIAFDSRYAKQDDFVSVQDTFSTAMLIAKTEIINEMRQEVVKNRTVMINAMQREADDLEFRMMELEQNQKPIPRYMSDKFKQINRQIEALQDDKETTD